MNDPKLRFSYLDNFFLIPTAQKKKSKSKKKGKIKRFVSTNYFYIIIRNTLSSTISFSYNESFLNTLLLLVFSGERPKTAGSKPSTRGGKSPK